MSLNIENYDQSQAPRVDTYQEWQAAQGIPVVRGFHVPDIKRL